MCMYVLKYVNRLDKIADRKEVCLRINIRKQFALTTYITKKTFVNRFVPEINRHLDGNLVCDNTKESCSDRQHRRRLFSIISVDFVGFVLMLPHVAILKM